LYNFKDKLHHSHILIASFWLLIVVLICAFPVQALFYYVLQAK